MEEILHELPFWRVAHFVWKIALGWRFHMGMIVLNTFQTPCLERTSRQHLVASLSTSLFHDDGHLGCSPNASLYAWERHYGDSLLRHHHITWRSLSYEDATGGGEETIQFYPCSFLGTRNTWEGRTVIFLH